MAKKIWFSVFLAFVVLTSSVYYLMPGVVRIDIEKTRTQYSVFEDNSYTEKIFNGTIEFQLNRTIPIYENVSVYNDINNTWENYTHVLNYTLEFYNETIDTWREVYHEDKGFVLAATEYVYLYDGTTKMRARTNGRELISWNDTNFAYTKRITKWKDNITTIQTYKFDKNAENVEDLPIENKLECINCEGKIIQFEVRDILYEGETKNIESPFSFGHRMKIEWQENDDFLWAKVYQQKVASDKIIVKYKAGSDYETYFVRLYDPWEADFNVGMKGYWGLNSSSGTNAFESTQGIHNGTHLNNPSVVEGLVTNARNYIAGSSQATTISDGSIFDLQGAEENWTMMIAINHTSFTGDQFIVARSSPTLGTCFAVRLGSGPQELIFDMPGGVKVSITQQSDLNDSIWNTVTVKHLRQGSQANVSIYANGNLIQNHLEGSPMPGTCTGSVDFGRRNYPGSYVYMTGRLGGVILWNKSLSSEEISNVSTEVLAGFGYTPTPVFEINLNSPLNNSFYSTGSINFLGDSSHLDGLLNLSLDVDGSILTTVYNTSSSQENLEINSTQTITEGLHNWSLISCNSNDVCEQSDYNSFKYFPWPESLSNGINFYYNFNQESGDITELVEGKYNATWDTTESWGTGIINASQNVAGSKYSDIADNAQWELGTNEDFSIGFWMYWTSAGNQWILYANKPATACGWVVGNENTNDIHFWPGTGSWNKIVNNVPENEWVRIDINYDESETNLTGYMNGNFSGQATVNINAVDCAFGKRIGANEVDGTPFSGQIDELDKYNRTKTELEMTQLYNDGMGRTYSDITEAPLPYFSIIPDNTSINYTQGFGVDFDGENTETYFINWTDTFQINQSGFLENSSSNLAVGTYEINVSINNSDNVINSTIYQVVVNQAIPSGTITGTSPIEYPLVGDVEGTESNQGDGGCTYNFFRDLISVSNPDTTILGAGTYNYLYNTSGCTNWTANASLDTFELTVNQNTSLTLGLTGTTPVEYPATTDFTGSNCPTELTCALNLTNQEFTAGNVSANYSTEGNTNYSATSTVFTITINKNSSTTLGITGTTPITYGTTTDVSTSGCPSQLICTLDKTNKIYEAGTHRFNYSTPGNINYTATSSFIDIVVDKDVPQGSLTSTLGWTINESQEITIGYTESQTGDDDVTYLVYRDDVSKGSGETWTPAYGIYQYILNTTGGQNWTENVSMDTQTLTVNDITSPLLEILFPTNNSNFTTSTVTINVSVIENNVDTLLWSNDSFTTNHTFSQGDNITETWEQGKNDINVWVNDSAGFENRTSVTFNIDSINPAVGVILPLNQTYTVSTVEFKVNATDTNLDYCNMSLDSADNITMSQEGINWTFTNTTMTDGAHSVQYYCFDTFGNVNDSEIVNFGVDLNNPEITIIRPDSIETVPVYNNSVNFTIESNEALARCNVTIDGGITNYTMTNLSTTIFYTNISLSRETYTSEFICEDLAGRINDSESKLFRVREVIEVINNSSLTLFGDYNVDYVYVEKGSSIVSTNAPIPYLNLTVAENITILGTITASGFTSVAGPSPGTGGAGGFANAGGGGAGHYGTGGAGGGGGGCGTGGAAGISYGYDTSNTNITGGSYGGFGESGGNNGNGGAGIRLYSPIIVINNATINSFGSGGQGGGGGDGGGGGAGSGGSILIKGNKLYLNYSILNAYGGAGGVGTGAGGGGGGGSGGYVKIFWDRTFDNDSMSINIAGGAAGSGSGGCGSGSAGSTGFYYSEVETFFDLRMNNPTENEFVNNPILFNCTTSDNGFLNITLFIDGTSNTTVYNTTSDELMNLTSYINLSDGSHSYYCRGFDGTSDIILEPLNFTSDSTAPNVTYISPADNFISEFINNNLTMAVNDSLNIKNVSLFTDIGGWSEKQTNITVNNATNYTVYFNISISGETVYALKACDELGNCELGDNRTIFLDLFDPIINIIYPNKSNYIVNVTEINYTSTDDYPGVCWYEKSGTNSSSVSYGTNFTDVDSQIGNNTIKVYCNDSRNNLGNATFSYFLDVIEYHDSSDPTNKFGTFPTDIFVNVTINPVFDLANITYTLYNFTGLYNETTYASDKNHTWSSVPDGIYYWNVTTCNTTGSCYSVPTRYYAAEVITLLLNNGTNNLTLELGHQINVNATSNVENVIVDVLSPEYGVNYSIGFLNNTFDLIINYFRSSNFLNGALETVIIPFINSTTINTGNFLIPVHQYDEVIGLVFNISGLSTGSQFGFIKSDNSSAFDRLYIGQLINELIFQNSTFDNSAGINELKENRTLSYDNTGEQLIYFYVDDNSNLNNFTLDIEGQNYGFNFTDNEFITYKDNVFSTALIRLGRVVPFLYNFQEFVVDDFSDSSVNTSKWLPNGDISGNNGAYDFSRSTVEGSNKITSAANIEEQVSTGFSGSILLENSLRLLSTEVFLLNLEELEFGLSYTLTANKENESDACDSSLLRIYIDTSTMWTSNLDSCDNGGGLCTSTSQSLDNLTFTISNYNETSLEFLINGTEKISGEEDVCGTIDTYKYWDNGTTNTIKQNCADTSGTLINPVYFTPGILDYPLEIYSKLDGDYINPTVGGDSGCQSVTTSISINYINKTIGKMNGGAYISTSVFDSAVDVTTLTMQQLQFTGVFTNYVSTDDGDNFQNIILNTSTPITSPGQHVKWNTTFVTNDTYCSSIACFPFIEEISLQTPKGFPTNVTLDLGNDGIDDYSLIGELNSTVNVDLSNIDISNFPVFSGTAEFGDHLYLVPLSVSSASRGIIYLDNFSLYYDPNPISLNLTSIQSSVLNLSGSDNLNLTIGAINGTFNLTSLAYDFAGGNQTIEIKAHNTEYSINVSLFLDIFYSSWDYFWGPDGVEWLFFSPRTPTEKNVTPYGQTSTIPILSIKNYGYGDANATLSIYQNDSLGCVNTTMSITNNSEDGILLNESWQTLTNLTYLENTTIYMWADYGCNYTTWRMFEPYLYFRQCVIDGLCSEDLF